MAVDIIQKIGTVVAVIITKGLIYFFYLLVREWLICKECLKCVSRDDEHSSDAEQLASASSSSAQHNCIRDPDQPSNSPGINSQTETDVAPMMRTHMEMENGGAPLKNPFDPPAYDSLFSNDYQHDPASRNP